MHHRKPKRTEEPHGTEVATGFEVSGASNASCPPDYAGTFHEESSCMGLHPGYGSVTDQYSSKAVTPVAEPSRRNGRAFTWVAALGRRTASRAKFARREAC